MWDTILLSMVSGDIPRIHRCLSLQKDNLDDEDEHSKGVSRNSGLSVHGHIAPNQKGYCAMFLRTPLYLATSFGKAPCSARVNHV